MNPEAPDIVVLEQGASRTGRAPINYTDVLLVINNQSAISMQIGNYFKLKRSLPDANVCNISMSVSEYLNPTQAATERASIKNFINASGLNGSLNYIVTTKGVPLGISDSGSKYAAFDDELALILGKYEGSIGNNGWINNPFYDSDERFSRQKFGFFIVTRLAGYDFTDCARLVDIALNSTGVRGTFVMDSQPWKDGGGYQEGNDWCRAANTTLTAKGYTVYMDDTPTYVANQQNVSGYGSWGSNDGNAGNNAKPSFTWVAGAVGTTYVSTSARSFNYPPSYGQSLIADLVREGITGVHGNVMEPYLGACSRPHILCDRYTRGWNLAESFSASMATGGWQNCIIGDPKIEPYSNQPDPAVLVGDLNASAGTIVEGMNITLNMKVRNLGGGPAENTTAAFYDGDPATGGKRLGPALFFPLLDAGAETPITVSWNTTSSAGVHRIYACITASNNTPQLDKGNDKVYREYTVYGKPDVLLDPQKFSLSDTSPREGDIVYINFTARNVGGYLVFTSLDVFCDGIKLNSRNVSLPSFAEFNESFAWNTTGYPGEHAIRVEAAPVQYETVLSNNALNASGMVRCFGLVMTAETVNSSCLPGLAAQFNISVRSMSNVAEGISITVSGAAAYWTSAVEPPSAVLFPNSTSTHRVLVYSPAFAIVTDKCTVNVKCSGAVSGISRELNLSVSVQPVYSLELSCEPTGASAIPGENATFKVNVKNLGNGPDSVNISCTVPEGWISELESNRLDIAYQGASSVMLKVSPGPLAIAGRSGNVEIMAVSLGGANFSATADVDVEQFFAAAASINVTGVTLRPTEMAEVSVLVCNLGNGADTFTLSAQKGELVVDVFPSTFQLGAFTNDSGTLQVTVPAGYTGQKEDVSIRVDSSKADRVYLTLRVNVVRPDISISTDDVKAIPAVPKAGETASITVNVHNKGSAPSGPVSVELSENGRVISTATISELEAGAASIAMFNWTATEGSHQFLVTVKCGYGNVTPADDSSLLAINVPLKPVPPKPDNPISGGSSGLVLAGVAILVIALVAFAALFMMKRKGPSAPATDAQDRPQAYTPLTKDASMPEGKSTGADGPKKDIPPGEASKEEAPKEAVPEQKQSLLDLNVPPENPQPPAQ